ncbi:MAG: hypothetical protein HYZ27_07815, partial [Deltaproteobacteria bacterium]|nr:hypothetical protein [Deltaproteobacteria bacterium]
PTRVFAVGQAPHIVLELNLDAGTLAPVPGVSELSDSGYVLRSIWGSSASDVWAVGSSGLAYHFDGGAWARVDVGAGDAGLNGVWGSSAADVFVVGEQGFATHFDGVGWTRESLPDGGSSAFTGARSPSTRSESTNQSTLTT